MATDNGLGDPRATDFYLLSSEFTPEQKSYLARTRALVRDSVLPVINGYLGAGLASLAAGREAR